MTHVRDMQSARQVEDRPHGRGERPGQKGRRDACARRVDCRRRTGTCAMTSWLQPARWSHSTGARVVRWTLPQRHSCACAHGPHTQPTSLPMSCVVTLLRLCKSHADGLHSIHRPVVHRPRACHLDRAERGARLGDDGKRLGSVARQGAGPRRPPNRAAQVRTAVLVGGRPIDLTLLATPARAQKARRPSCRTRHACACVHGRSAPVASTRLRQPQAAGPARDWPLAVAVDEPAPPAARLGLAAAASRSLYPA